MFSPWHERKRAFARFGTGSDTRGRSGCVLSQGSQAVASEMGTAKRAHKAAACDKWFRARVQESLDDPRAHLARKGIGALGEDARASGKKAHGPAESEGLRVFWRPLAEADRDAILDYIARDNPAAAIAMGDTIDRRVADLPQHPRL